MEILFHEMLNPTFWPYKSVWKLMQNVKKNFINLSSADFAERELKVILNRG